MSLKWAGMPPLDLDKTDLIHLLRGIGPGTSEQQATVCFRFGARKEGVWSWDARALRAASNEELWGLYQEIKRRRVPF